MGIAPYSLACADFVFWHSCQQGFQKQQEFKNNSSG
jgi:hypothetical protein